MKLSLLTGEACDPDPDIKGIATDSRAVKDGFLFAALPGEYADGADYILQAEKNGAAAILAAPGGRAGVPVINDPAPRQKLAQIAARFYPNQPAMIAGVTGTNGKTSTARFAAQLWRLAGEKAGSIGTLGASAPGFEQALGFTTPEPVALHQTLDAMARAGVTHVAMEVSSHGLAHFRADGVKFAAAAFTNITQDHLDFHDGFEDYFAAKLRLFTALLPSDGYVVVNADGEGAGQIIAAVKSRALRILTVGAKGNDVKLTALSPRPAGLHVSVRAGSDEYTLNLPLVGAFQVENALLAAGIVIGGGADPADILPRLEALNGVPGRMQFAARANGAAVYVDYAHTPDAIATALYALRPHTQGKLIVVIGAGGDRDSDKRPLMGKAAAIGADQVIVTDDNPRSEAPAVIRGAVLRGCPDAEEIGDRGEAIARGVAVLSPGDILLIAGKGHEAGQIVGGETLPFDDVKVAQAAAENREEVG